MSAKPNSPYKGLNAFEDSELDALLFFGREREREIVVANLIASRLTVLYGPSGVGKSSLLRAAVARSLRELPEEPIVVVFSSWSDDPNLALAEAVGEASGTSVDGSAAAALERVQAERDVYLVLDQAEEYFLYHADDGGDGSFAEALPAMLGAQLRINVLVSLREDSLAKLDRFTGRIPGLFSNTLRLDRLDRDAARAAVVRPLERYAELTDEDVSIEPGLVERVLDEVGTGQIEPALGGLGVVEETARGTRIEAPYLQLVMQRLWDEERSTGSTVLRAATLERLGGAQHIVEEHLAGAMAELSSDQKDIAARLFNHLVTPSGTKIAHDVSDLADFGNVSVAEVQPVLSRLAGLRILRSIEEGGRVRYEIFHDVLAEPVLAWRTEYETERELAAQKSEADRRHRRLLAVIAVGAVLLAAMSAVTVYALSQRSEARGLARDARADELEASADAELEKDPELSLLLAMEAARLAPGPRAEQAVRESLLQSRARAVVDVGEPLLEATMRRSRLLAVTEAGDVVVAKPGTGEVVRRISTGSPAVDASFADDGSAVVTDPGGRVRSVRSGHVAVVPGVDQALDATSSPDGSLVLVVERNRVRLVDVETGTGLHVYPHPGARVAAISYDNRRVVTGGLDRRVVVWSGQSGRRIHSLVEHLGRPSGIAFSPDGTLVASASSDGIGRIWRTSDWGLHAVLAGDGIGLTTIAFSADGEHAVTGGRDGTARVFHADTGSPLFALIGHRGRISSARFTGGAGSSIVTSSADGSVRVWDAVFQPQLDELADVGAPVAFVEFAEDGQLRVGTVDRRVHGLDARTGEEQSVESGVVRRRRVIAPDGSVATIRGRTVSLRAGGRQTVLSGHRDRVTSVAFSGDGSLLATASLDHDVRVWDVATARQLLLLPHNTAVHDAQFSPGDRWLVTAANRVGLWDLRTGDVVLRLQGHEGTATAATFDSSGRRIVTGGVDGTVRTFGCDVCGGLDDLLALADQRLAATRRELTRDEREQFLR
jgi:WD40 repeat protein